MREKIYEMKTLIKNISKNTAIFCLVRFVFLNRYTKATPAFIQRPPRVAPKPSPPIM